MTGKTDIYTFMDCPDREDVISIHGVHAEWCNRDDDNDCTCGYNTRMNQCPRGYRR
jgi:hypothetical protein